MKPFAAILAFSAAVAMIAAMLTFSVPTIDAARWHKALSRLADLSLPQTWNYGEAKAAAAPWRVERGLLVDGGGAVAGAAQVMLRDLPGGLPGGLAWVSRGPLWRHSGAGQDGEHLSAALDAVADHYAGRRGYYLRMAPPAPQGLWPGSGPLAMVRLRGTGTGGWASALLDLTRPQAELHAGLAQKWRNAANKAERSGITVTRTFLAGDRHVEPMTAFLADYAQFLAERSLETTVTPALLAMLADSSAPGEGLVLLEARQGDARLGWTLLARYGDTAEYLAGVVGAEGRDAGAGQLLLWRAVQAAQETGCRHFDLGGLDPDLTPEGIRRFKEGLGGAPYRLMSEVEALPSGLLAGMSGRLVRWRVGRARAALAG